MSPGRVQCLEQIVQFTRPERVVKSADMTPLARYEKQLYACWEQLVSIGPDLLMLLGRELLKGGHAV